MTPEEMAASIDAARARIREGIARINALTDEERRQILIYLDAFEPGAVDQAFAWKARRDAEGTAGAG